MADAAATGSRRGASPARAVRSKADELQPSSRCRSTRKKIKGLSEKILVSHYENNYSGAVKRLNAISEQLAGLDYAKAPGFLINGLKREELIGRLNRTGFAGGSTS